MLSVVHGGPVTEAGGMDAAGGWLLCACVACSLDQLGQEPVEAVLGEDEGRRGGALRRPPPPTTTTTASQATPRPSAALYGVGQGGACESHVCDQLMLTVSRPATKGRPMISEAATARGGRGRSATTRTDKQQRRWERQKGRGGAAMRPREPGKRQRKSTGFLPTQPGRVPRRSIHSVVGHFADQSLYMHGQRLTAHRHWSRGGRNRGGGQTRAAPRWLAMQMPGSGEQQHGSRQEEGCGLSGCGRC